MKIELSVSNMILALKPGLPNDYRGPILKGSVVMSAQSSLAEIVLQHLTGAGYSIVLSSGKLLNKMLKKERTAQYGLHSNFILKNEARKEIKNIGEFCLKKDQYICYLSKEEASTIHFAENEEFRKLDFFYSPQLLKELVPLFPQLKRILQHSTQKILHPQDSFSIPMMKEIMNQIIDCPYDKNTRIFYYDLKVRELLLQLLERTFKRNTSVYIFQSHEKTRIYEAKSILEKNIDKKTPTIKELCKLVALNEFKLKTGFKKYFSSGIFEFMMQQKMKKAKSLLLTTNKPIKEIASMVGYPRTTNFITAFRKIFGVTPGELRR